MARVSKTSPFHARRPSETRANNEGQEQREDTQTQSNPEDDEIIRISSSEEETNEKKNKRKGKSPMKKPVKRGRGSREPIKGVVIGARAKKTRLIKDIVAGLPSKASETASTSPKRGRGRGRKTTFAVRSASYEAFEKEQEEKVTIGDLKRIGQEKMEETDVVEEDEACKRITKERNMDDDKDKDDDDFMSYCNTLEDINVV